MVNTAKTLIGIDLAYPTSNQAQGLPDPELETRCQVFRHQALRVQTAQNTVGKAVRSIDRIAPPGYLGPL